MPRFVRYSLSDLSVGFIAVFGTASPAGAFAHRGLKMFTKQQLTPDPMELFDCVKQALPDKIASRLRSNRHFVNHGSYADLFLFECLGRNQTDVLDRKHFKSCLGYRPNHPTHDGYFHLWLNRIRIYRQREEIVALLDRELPRLTPSGFTFHPHGNRAFNMGFDIPTILPILLHFRVSSWIHT